MNLQAKLIASVLCAGALPLFAQAADFEDFRVERPTLPASMESELEPVIRLLAENRWPDGLSLARSRRRRRGPRCTRSIEVKQACRADAQTSKEICLRARTNGHGRLAVIRLCSPRAWSRKPARARTKGNPRIGLVHAEARHLAAMVPESRDGARKNPLS